MSVTRISEFQAKQGQGDRLRDLIASFVPRILGSEGCISCQLLQSRDDPTRLVVIELWESVEAHQQSAQQVPREALEAAMQLVAGPARGGYYRSV